MPRTNKNTCYRMQLVVVGTVVAGGRAPGSARALHSGGVTEPMYRDGIPHGKIPSLPQGGV